VDWLGDPAWAMPAIILMAVWKNFGYNMIIFIAGLQSIPGELYEAARVDGAGPLAQFWHVTLPLLAPTFLFVGVLTMVGYFQLFAEPYVMTQGGPLGATRSVVLLMYEEGFRWWNMGYASAVAFALFAVILAATLVQLRLQRGTDERGGPLPPCCWRKPSASGAARGLPRGGAPRGPRRGGC
jgi:multiple sugar transport system permease protein